MPSSNTLHRAYNLPLEIQLAIVKELGDDFFRLRAIGVTFPISTTSNLLLYEALCSYESHLPAQSIRSPLRTMDEKELEERLAIYWQHKTYPRGMVVENVEDLINAKRLTFFTLSHHHFAYAAEDPVHKEIVVRDITTHTAIYLRADECYFALTNERLAYIDEGKLTVLRLSDSAILSCHALNMERTSRVQHIAAHKDYVAICLADGSYVALVVYQTGKLFRKRDDLFADAQCVVFRDGIYQAIVHRNYRQNISGLTVKQYDLDGSFVKERCWDLMTFEGFDTHDDILRFEYTGDEWFISFRTMKQTYNYFLDDDWVLRDGLLGRMRVWKDRIYKIGKRIEVWSKTGQKIGELDIDTLDAIWGCDIVVNHTFLVVSVYDWKPMGPRCHWKVLTFDDTVKTGDHSIGWTPYNEASEVDVEAAENRSGHCGF